MIKMISKTHNGKSMWKYYHKYCDLEINSLNGRSKMQSCSKIKPKYTNTSGK